MKKALVSIIFMVFVGNSFAVENPEPGALPERPSVKPGEFTGETVQIGPSTMQIRQRSYYGTIHWATFDIGTQASITFLQPNANSVTLNKVDFDSQASSLLGTINATGHVFVINPNGVIFGSNLITNLDGVLLGGVNVEFALDQINNNRVGLGETPWAFRVNNIQNTVALNSHSKQIYNFLGKKEVAITTIDQPALDLANAIIIDLQQNSGANIQLVRMYNPPGGWFGWFANPKTTITIRPQFLAPPPPAAADALHAAPLLGAPAQHPQQPQVQAQQQQQQLPQPAPAAPAMPHQLGGQQQQEQQIQLQPQLAIPFAEQRNAAWEQQCQGGYYPNLSEQQFQFKDLFIQELHKKTRKKLYPEIQIKLAKQIKTQYQDIYKIVIVPTSVEFAAVHPMVFTALFSGTPTKILLRSTSLIDKLIQAIKIVDQNFHDPSITKITVDCIASATKLKQTNYINKEALGQLYSTVHRNIIRLCVLGNLKGDHETRPLIEKAINHYNALIASLIGYYDS